MRKQKKDPNCFTEKDDNNEIAWKNGKQRTSFILHE